MFKRKNIVVVFGKRAGRVIFKYPDSFLSVLEPYCNNELKTNEQYRNNLLMDLMAFFYLIVEREAFFTFSPDNRDIYMEALQKSIAHEFDRKYNQKLSYLLQDLLDENTKTLGVIALDLITKKNSQSRGSLFLEFSNRLIDKYKIDPDFYIFIKEASSDIISKLISDIGLQNSKQ